CIAIAPRELRSADQECRRQRIGPRGIRGDHAGAHHAMRRPSGPRIDDVAVPLAVDDDELLARAARTERAVTEGHAREPPGGCPWRSNVDWPAASLTPDSQHAAASGRHERVPNGAATQQTAHSIHRVALPDRAEIQRHSGGGEAYGHPAGIERDA